MKNLEEPPINADERRLLIENLDQNSGPGDLIADPYRRKSASIGGFIQR
jgi:hypothetical protein